MWFGDAPAQDVAADLSAVIEAARRNYIRPWDAPQAEACPFLSLDRGIAAMDMVFEKKKEHWDWGLVFDDAQASPYRVCAMRKYEVEPGMMWGLKGLRSSRGKSRELLVAAIRALNALGVPVLESQYMDSDWLIECETQNLTELLSSGEMSKREYNTIMRSATAMTRGIDELRRVLYEPLQANYRSLRASDPQLCAAADTIFGFYEKYSGMSMTDFYCDHSRMPFQDFGSDAAYPSDVWGFVWDVTGYWGEQGLQWADDSVNNMGINPYVRLVDTGAKWDMRAHTADVFVSELFELMQTLPL